MKYESTKIIELGSCAFRQWKANHSHCKFIHGYRLQAKFWFGCNELDEKNWVVDFGGLDDLKNILQKQFDHTLCVADDDPLLEGFKSLHTAGGCDLRVMQGGVGIEKTAEWCFNTANEYCLNITNGRCWVEKVEVWEHEKNSAIVTKNDNTFKVNVQNSLEVNNTETRGAPQNHVRNFMADIAEQTGVNLETVIKNPPPISNKPGAGQPHPQPAPVKNKVTSGWSDLFGGTSWGANR